MPSQFRDRTYSPFDLIHFTVRGQNRRIIFHDQNDHDEFRAEIYSLIDEVPWPLGPRLLAWAQMPNHQHVFMQCGEAIARPRKIMRAAVTRYALSYNWRNGSAGQVFQRRFRNQLVRGGTHIINTFAYIHLNPDASLRDTNSSHAFYAGLTSDPIIDPEIAWNAFGSQQAYLDFFADNERLRAARTAAKLRLG